MVRYKIGLDDPQIQLLRGRAIGAASAACNGWNVLLVVLTIVFAGCDSRSPDAGAKQPTPPLVCYVSTNMRASLEELAREHEKRTGQKVSIEVADARTLISQIEATHSADLFICHDPFLRMALNEGIEIKHVWAIASVSPVIAVRKGNQKKIMQLEDLARPGLRIGLTDADNSISGHIVTHMLQKAGIAEKVKANVIKRTLQGTDVAKSLVAGDIDACIVWNAVVHVMNDKIEAVDIRAEFRPKFGVDHTVDSPTMGHLELDYVRVTVATLSDSKQPKKAKAFAEFVASPEGLTVLQKNGFSPPIADRPALAPAK